LVRAAESGANGYFLSRSALSSLLIHPSAPLMGPGWPCGANFAVRAFVQIWQVQ
jgi:hypothetical protein